EGGGQGVRGQQQSGDQLGHEHGGGRDRRTGIRRGGRRPGGRGGWRRRGNPGGRGGSAGGQGERAGDEDQVEERAGPPGQVQGGREGQSDRGGAGGQGRRAQAGWDRAEQGRGDHDERDRQLPADLRHGREPGGVAERAGGFERTESGDRDREGGKQGG